MITTERLRALLDYHPESGIFRWKKLTHRIPFGSVAGYLTQQGYRRIGVDGRNHFAHRLAWFYVHGKWPNGLIDHINKDTDDNRIVNLREATPQQNSSNLRNPKPNRFGCRGIVWTHTSANWGARIYHQGKAIWLGSFPTIEEARDAYTEADRRLRGAFAATAPISATEIMGPAPLAREPRHLSIDRLREVVDYNPATGILTWKIDAWTGRYSKNRVGTVAGKLVASTGYLRLSIDGQRFLAHRVAWFHHTGVMPTNLVDHVNGVRTDNRIANLREATLRENSFNKSARGATPLKGIYQRGKGWTASISVDHRKHNLGTFPTPEEAHAAYMAAARQYFGEFARGS